MELSLILMILIVIIDYNILSTVNGFFLVTNNRLCSDGIHPYSSYHKQKNTGDIEDVPEEAMFSLSYDPLESPNQSTFERDLEDTLIQRANRFYEQSVAGSDEKCYLVGLIDKSSEHSDSKGSFSLEESLTELSELAGAAGLCVVGSTYQRVQKPNIQYYIGQGKTKEIARSMSKLKCTCVIFDTELTPSQQKNLELALNQDNVKDKKLQLKVIDRTALILDIFAQHAKTKEGQLQVQLALLTYRLPRLTNLWTHLERQSAGSKGRSNGGVGLRGPGEKQLESDRREMKKKISLLNKAIDDVRRHRAMHRRRRRRLGLPVVALVGYTNSGKSTLLNALSSAGVFAADMLFATLDPTTRVVSMSSKPPATTTDDKTDGSVKSNNSSSYQNIVHHSIGSPSSPSSSPSTKTIPDVLITDTVGFIQKLPTNLVAAFRATLEEIAEADILLHVTDITNDAWRKQEAAVLTELSNMGLSDKPIITVWNKIDLIPDRKEFFKFEANKRPQTVALSAQSGEGIDRLMHCIEEILSAQLEHIDIEIKLGPGLKMLDSIHSLSLVEELIFNPDSIHLKGKTPRFLKDRLMAIEIHTVDEEDSDALEDAFDILNISYADVNHSFDSDDATEEASIEYDHLTQIEDMIDSRRSDTTNSKLSTVESEIDWVALGKGRHKASKNKILFKKKDARTISIPLQTSQDISFS